MILLPLNNSNKKVMISDIDECLLELEWFIKPFNPNNGARARIAHIKDSGQFLYLHRHIAVAMWMKPIPLGYYVQLKDKNVFNHQRENIIIQHGSNTKLSSSGFKGVHKTYTNAFEAKIKVDGVLLHLGTFKTAEEAAKVYQDALNGLIDHDRKLP